MHYTIYLAKSATASVQNATIIILGHKASRFWYNAGMSRFPFEFTQDPPDAATAARRLDHAQDIPERRAVSLASCGARCIPALGRSRYRTISPHLPEHIHPNCIEFNYCIDGSLSLEKAGRLHQLKPGNIFVAKPDESHHLVENSKGLFMYWMIVRLPGDGTRMLGLPAKDSAALASALINIPQTTFAADRSMASRFRRLFVAYDLDNGNQLKSARIRSLVLDILLAMIDCGGVPVTVDRFSKIEAAADAMRTDPGKNHDLDRLAAEAGLGRVRFTQLFKQATGLPPYAFLLRTKVERAQKLLSETDNSIAEIAKKLGLSSSRHLATLFRETVGVTPTAYRKA